MATRVYMHTLGCPKNRVDSEVMLGTLAQAGFRLVQDPADADVVVVNTCGFIESAKVESVDAIVELAELKRTGRAKKLVVTGCLVQRHADELARELPEVDHFLGTGAYPEIARIVSDAQAKRLVVPDPDFVHSAATPRVNSLPSHTAYLKISEGCSNACSFCSIPLMRGDQRSRPVDAIVREAAGLASGGVRELHLVAQDLTQYGFDLRARPDLVDLVRALSGVAGLEWIRLLYAHPAHLTPRMLSELRWCSSRCWVWRMNWSPNFVWRTRSFKRTSGGNSIECRRPVCSECMGGSTRITVLLTIIRWLRSASTKSCSFACRARSTKFSFTSADPTVTDPMNMQGWNRYSYVGNDPLAFTDREVDAVHRLHRLVAAADDGAERGGQPRGAPVDPVVLREAADVDHGG